MTIIPYTYLESDIIRLYSSVGWTSYTDNLPALRAGFDNSLLTLAAYEGDELLGILRAVGDGATIVYIQDILVFPEYQRMGIGTALLKEVLARFKDVRQIGLMTDNTSEMVAFYESIGFRKASYVGCLAFIRCI